MNNKTIKLFALTAALLVATQPLSAMWEEETLEETLCEEEILTISELTEKLFSRIENNDLEAVKEILTNYPDLDLVNAKEDNGWTALYWAVLEQNLEMMRLLIEFAANVNVKDQENWTPTHYAACYGELEMVALLGESGADISIQNDSGLTPLDLAKERRHQDIITYLTHK